MRILINAAAAFHYRRTGIGVYAAELLKAMAEIKRSDDIFVFNGERILPLKTCFSVPHRTERDFWQRQAARKIETAATFDVVHNLQNGIGDKGPGRHSVLTVHDMIPLLLPQYCGSPYREIFCREALPAIKEADAVITVSACSKKDIMDLMGVGEDKIHVIAEAPKADLKPIAPAVAAAFLRKHFLLRPPFFLYVGGLNERKNVSGLIRAYAGIRPRLPRQCPLIVIGSGEKRRERLRKLVGETGVTSSVRFLDHVGEKDLPYFYSAAAALIYPSFYEGFGLPPLEAAACACPSVVADRSSLPEIMADCAVYVDPDDPVAMGKAMLRLVKDDGYRNRLGGKAARLGEKYSFLKTASKTLSIYENLCR